MTAIINRSGQRCTVLTLIDAACMMVLMMVLGNHVGPDNDGTPKLQVMTLTDGPNSSLSRAGHRLSDLTIHGPKTEG